MLLATLFLLALPPQIFAYKILMVPLATGFNSRLLNMQKLADVLAQDGHEVTVLMNTKVKDHRITKYAKVLHYAVHESIIDIEAIDKKQMNVLEMISMLNDYRNIEYPFVHAMMTDKMVLEAIYKSKFDLICGDTQDFVSYALVSHLNITTIWYQNVLIPYDSKVFYPTLPSFVCTMPASVCHQNEMPFKEKLANFLIYLYFNYYLTSHHLETVKQIAEQSNFDIRVPLDEVTKNKIVVINANYVLDTPIPTMPHIFPISGLFHTKPSPLEKQFQDIIDSSQPHGVILLSFGTLITEFDEEKADMFARVLGRLRHSIIWRFTGHPPKSLKANTHLVKWFPQNDLLANPAVKLFITHCGISSTFESALHGVPVLAMPLFADQDDNADKLTKRVKTGFKADFYTLTEEQFQQSLNEVLSNPEYKENAKKTSYLLNDNLVSPQQQLRHLVNFTIKSGGAPHLFHPYAVDMNWFQFYSLDVISFLVTVTIIIGLAVAYVATITLKCFQRAMFKSKKD